MPEQSKHGVIDLFKQLGTGSEKALKEIADLYKNRLVRYTSGILQNTELAKEVFSDTLQALWDNKEKIAKMENPEKWMITTAHNKAVNKARDEKRNHSFSLQQFPDLKSFINIESEIETKELNRQLQLAEEKLNPKEKLVFTLSKKQGLSRKEIATLFNVSENTVRNQLRNALKSMRMHLSKLTNLFLI